MENSTSVKYKTVKDIEKPFGIYHYVAEQVIAQNFTGGWLGGLLVERRTSVSQIRSSIPRQVAAV